MWTASLLCTDCEFGDSRSIRTYVTMGQKKFLLTSCSNLFCFFLIMGRGLPSAAFVELHVEWIGTTVLPFAYSRAQGILAYSWVNVAQFHFPQNTIHFPCYLGRRISEFWGSAFTESELFWRCCVPLSLPFEMGRVSLLMSDMHLQLSFYRAQYTSLTSLLINRDSVPGLPLQKTSLGSKAL